MKATVEGVVLIPTVIKITQRERVVRLWWTELTFSVLDDSGVVSFHDSNTRVCSSEIDTNNAAKRLKILLG